MAQIDMLRLLLLLKLRYGGEWSSLTACTEGPVTKLQSHWTPINNGCYSCCGRSLGRYVRGGSALHGVRTIEGRICGGGGNESAGMGDVASVIHADIDICRYEDQRNKSPTTACITPQSITAFNSSVPTLFAGVGYYQTIHFHRSVLRARVISAY